MDWKLEDLENQLHCAQGLKPVKGKVCVKIVVKNSRNLICRGRGGISRTYSVDEVTELFLSTNKQPSLLMQTLLLPSLLSVPNCQENYICRH